MAQLGKGSLGSFELGSGGSSVFEESASSTLVLISSAATGGTGSSILALVSDATAARGKPASASSTLAFVDSADGIHAFVESVTSTLALVSSESDSASHFLSSVISFVSSATFSTWRYVSATSAMSLVSGEGEAGPRYNAVDTFISFLSEAFSPQVFIEYVSQFIPFDSEGGTDRPQSASNTLVFTQLAYNSHTASSILSLVSTAQGSLGLDNELNFQSVATRTAILHRSTDSEISFSETLTYWVDSPCLEENYHPFVGTTNNPNDPTPPSTTVPVLGTATLTLTYPFVSPTTTLILRNPEFANADALSFSRINRQSRGGTAILFADRKWPKQQVLNMDIRALTQTQAEDFLDFVTQSLGQEIGLLDHENRQWRGILDPSAALNDAGLECNYSTHIQFEGTLV